MRQACLLKASRFEGQDVYMSMLRYAVLLCGEEWRVVSGSRRIGRFSGKADAIAAGARLANEAAKMGHAVEFLVQSESGELLCQAPD